MIYIIFYSISKSDFSMVQGFATILSQQNPKHKTNHVYMYL